MERDGCLEELPVRLQRVKLVDELARVRQEIMVVVLVSGIIEACLILRQKIVQLMYVSVSIAPQFRMCRALVNSNPHLQ